MTPVSGMVIDSLTLPTHGSHSNLVSISLWTMKMRVRQQCEEYWEKYVSGEQLITFQASYISCIILMEQQIL